MNERDEAEEEAAGVARGRRAGVTKAEGDSRPEASQVHDEQGRNVVGLAPEVLLPKALLPEPEALHVLVVVTERREAERGSLQNSNS